MKVTRQIVKDLSNTYGGGNNNTSITIHETANTNNGADAEAHADLQSNGNSRDASWHYSVDDHSGVPVLRGRHSVLARGRRPGQRQPALHRHRDLRQQGRQLHAGM